MAGLRDVLLRIGRRLLSRSGLGLLTLGSAFALDPSQSVTQYARQSWTTLDGLPQNSVRAIVQTSDGYLWLGTQAGLACFDGVQFTTYDEFNTPQMKSDHILSLKAARDGSLWIGTAMELLRLKDGRFYRFTNPRISGEFNVRAIEEDRHGTIWVGTDSEGLLRLERGNSGAVFKPAGVRGPVRSLLEDSRGRLWVGSDTGLSKIENGLIVTRYTTRDGLGHNAVWALAEGTNGALWIGTRLGGLSLLTGNNFRTYTEKDGLLNSIVLSLATDRAGNLWIGTDGGGLARFTAGVISAYGINHGLSSSIVRTVFEDREGNLWMGTAGGGLTQLADERFTTYTAHADGLTSNLIWSIHAGSRGTMWIGTSGGGISRFRNGMFEPAAPSPQLQKELMWPVYEDRDGRLWAGAEGGKLYCRVRGKWLVYPRAGDPVFHERFTSILQDSSGDVWIGTSTNKLYRFHDDRFIVYSAEEGIGQDWVRAIAEDHSGNLWLATHEGLKQRRGDRFITYTTRDGLSTDAIRSLHVAKDGSLWIGTVGGGLNVSREGKFTALGTGDDMPDDSVNAIAEDATGDIWITCMRGLFRLSRDRIERRLKDRHSRLVFESFHSAVNIANSEFNYGAQPAVARTADGDLWFPTYGGIVVVKPGQTRTNLKPPPVDIHQIVVDGTPVDVRRSTKFGPAAGNLVIHYTALSFRSSERVRFRYKLEGVDADWVDAEGRRAAYYTNVSPGKYRFLVVAANSDGVWSVTPEVLDFELLPHLYQTRWFYGGAGLLLTLMAVGAYMRHVRVLRTRERWLEANVEARTEELRREIRERRHAEEVACQASRVKSEFVATMSHEIRTPMNGVMGMTALLLDTKLDRVQREYVESLRTSGEALLTLINEILDFSKIEAGKMKIDCLAFDLAACLEEAVSLLRPRALEKGLELCFSYPEEAPRFVLGDPGRIRQVVLNLASNAIKFTESGHVTIEIEFTPDGFAGRFCVRVRDTGMGIPKEKQALLFEEFTQLDTSSVRRHSGTGLGLAIVRKLVQAMGGVVEVESSPGVGSCFCFTLRLPLAGAGQTGPIPDLTSAEASLCEPPLPEEDGGRVLLAEDNFINTKVAAAMLRKLGFQVDVAKSGREAVNAVAETSYRLIFMDCHMPELDGYDATGLIRKMSGPHAATPIIAMTANAMPGDRERCFAAGMDGYLAKPLRMEELRHTVRDILSRTSQIGAIH